MRQVALPESHEEADSLDALQVAAKRLKLLVVEEVHVLLSDLVEVIFALDCHRRGLDPVSLVERLLVLDGDLGLVVLRIRDPVAALRRHLADVDLGVEVRRERIPVVAAVAVEDVERLDCVEIVLLRVGGEHLRDAGVEAAAEDRGKPRLLEPLAVRPLPGVLEVRLVRRLVVRGVEIGHPRLEARVHDCEILIGKRDVHDKIGLELADHRDEARRVHRVDLRRRDLRRDSLLREPRALLDVRLDRVAARLRARGDKKFAEDFGIAGHLCGRHSGYSAGSNEHHFLRHVAFLS